MPVIIVTADYDGNANLGTVSGYSKVDTGVNLPVGMLSTKEETFYQRTFIRFSLADLPSGVTVTQVKLRVYCNNSGGASHLLDVHAYNTNGQTDPQPDGAQDCYNRCASGNLYINDSTELRTTGTKWFTLGGTVCDDVEAAKAAVNRFTLGLHEEGDNDAYAWLDAIESGGTLAQIEITYTEAAPPPGYSYSDGLVTVQC